MNFRLSELNPYPFEKLKLLIKDIKCSNSNELINLHIGEPTFPVPDVIINSLKENLNKFSTYPSTVGDIKLRQACSSWLYKRYGINVSALDEILPVNGSREGLFTFIQSCINNNVKDNPIIVCPDPFYQIYEGAGILAGAKLYFINSYNDNFIPNWYSIPSDIWDKVQIVIVCTPNNPTGSVIDLENWKILFEYQEKYNFVIMSDECYSEIYFDKAPIGILEATKKLGLDNNNKIMFTSLSKRSNVPGLRSGFVAGDTKLIKNFLLYRTYSGGAMSLVIQEASKMAWLDERHVIYNRNSYKEKFLKVLPILRKKFKVNFPEATFYIWLPLYGIDDQSFTKKLFIEKSVLVLPGSFLSKNINYNSNISGYVRIALVEDTKKCIQAANRIVELI